MTTHNILRNFLQTTINYLTVENSLSLDNQVITPNLSSYYLLYEIKKLYIYISNFFQFLFFYLSEILLHDTVHLDFLLKEIFLHHRASNTPHAPYSHPCALINHVFSKLKTKSQKLLSLQGRIELDKPNNLSLFSSDLDQF